MHDFSKWLATSNVSNDHFLDPDLVGLTPFEPKAGVTHRRYDFNDFFVCGCACACFVDSNPSIVIHKDDKYGLNLSGSLTGSKNNLGHCNLQATTSFITTSP